MRGACHTTSLSHRATSVFLRAWDEFLPAWCVGGRAQLLHAGHACHKLCIRGHMWGPLLATHLWHAHVVEGRVGQDVPEVDKGTQVGPVQGTDFGLVAGSAGRKLLSCRQEARKAAWPGNKKPLSHWQSAQDRLAWLQGAAFPSAECVRQSLAAGGIRCKDG